MEGWKIAPRGGGGGGEREWGGGGEEGEGGVCVGVDGGKASQTDKLTEVTVRVLGVCSHRD